MDCRSSRCPAISALTARPRGTSRLDTAAELSDAKRKEVRRAAALRRSLAAEACSALRRAKELHDELEAAYHPFVDFRALTRFEQKHLEKVFSA